MTAATVQDVYVMKERRTAMESSRAQLSAGGTDRRAVRLNIQLMCYIIPLSFHQLDRNREVK